MSKRRRRFYYADGSWATVTPTEWARKSRAQAAAAARHGKVVWRNSKGRVAVLTPEQAAQRQDRSERIKAAPRLQGGRLGEYQRPVAELAVEAPAPEKRREKVQTPEGEVAATVEERGDFRDLVAAAIDLGKSLGVDFPFGLVAWRFEDHSAYPPRVATGGPIPFRTKKGNGDDWWASAIFDALVDWQAQTGGDTPGDGARGYRGGWRPSGGETEAFGFTDDSPIEYVEFGVTVVTLYLSKKSQA